MLSLIITHTEVNNKAVEKFSDSHVFNAGHAVAQWLRHCATNRKVAGSIPEGVIGIFY
jgi:hypothetical protein